LASPLFFTFAVLFSYGNVKGFLLLKVRRPVPSTTLSVAPSMQLQQQIVFLPPLFFILIDMLGCSFLLFATCKVFPFPILFLGPMLFLSLEVAFLGVILSHLLDAIFPPLLRESFPYLFKNFSSSRRFFSIQRFR